MRNLVFLAGLGALMSFSFVAFANADDATSPATDPAAAAQKGCLEAAQSRYSAAADAVKAGEGAVKWDSGLKGYKVEIAITRGTGKADNYVCVARKDGSYKFFAG